LFRTSTMSAWVASRLARSEDESLGAEMNWWIDNELSAYDASVPMARIERRTGGTRDMVEAGRIASLSGRASSVVSVHLRRCSASSQPRWVAGLLSGDSALCHVAPRGQLLTGLRLRWSASARTQAWA